MYKKKPNKLKFNEVNISIGEKVYYIQGGDGKSDKFGFMIKGKVIGCVPIGDSMHKLLHEKGYKIKSYTVDISIRCNRFLVDLGDGRYGTPQLDKCCKLSGVSA